MTIKTEKNHTASRPHEEKSALRQALPQILAVCVKNVLLLGFGMTLGFPTILIPSLSGNGSEEQISLDSEAISWIGSINLICVPVGCLMSGAITQPLGRKRAMQLVNIPFLTAWLLFHFSTDAWHVFLALCITGISGGLLEAPVLTYVAEITQPHLRGMLSSTSTLAVIIGTLIQFLLGTFMSWRIVALANIVVPILSLSLLYFVPESPHWLTSKGRYDEAKKGIAWLRGWTTIEEIEGEFQDLCKQLGKANHKIDDNDNRMKDDVESLGTVHKLSISERMKLFRMKSFYWPYCLVCLAFALGHFNGMTTLQTYAIQIFETLKSPIDKYYATIILGAVEAIGCIGCVFLVHILGKRILNMISLVGCGICFIIVASYAYIIDVKYFDDSTSETEEEPSSNWIPMVFLILSAFTSHMGIRILPWILIGEVYSNETRALASGFSSGSGYVIGFVANKMFLTTVENLTLPGTFFFYSAVSLGGAVILFFVLPETEGKTLLDITEHFAGRSKLRNSVHKKKTITVGQQNQAFEPDDRKNYVTESKF